MTPEPGQALRLPHLLRELRELEWSDVELTQAQLAAAFSAESTVTQATVNSWESPTNPMTPSASELRAYARFFAARRSLENEPHLIPKSDLTHDEFERYRELEAQLLGLIQAATPALHKTFTFAEGPVVIVAPEAPRQEQGPLADPSNPNFNRLQLFADQDALLELWGHLRAENPDIRIHIRLPSELVAEDLYGHVILLGGIPWNRMTRRFQMEISQVPITQVEVSEPITGEIFTTKDADGERSFYPEFQELAAGERDLIEDVGHIARLRNPFQSNRTLTICNGIHSRGVLGAVRSLSDLPVREANELYLAERFPGGRFAVLVRVFVVANETLSPDLHNPAMRLYEWPAPRQARDEAAHRRQEAAPEGVALAPPLRNKPSHLRSADEDED